ncbi:hypothetical protein PUN28_004276 [Cardiocondyla obscurior]|uniref:Uncharacterized protein n=1 Tax=Cardiocondyla obscurior TaxID=286306 RepID=A0AAW2GDU7_9HYME
MTPDRLATSANRPFAHPLVLPRETQTDEYELRFVAPIINVFLVRAKSRPSSGVAVSVAAQLARHRTRRFNISSQYAPWTFAKALTMTIVLSADCC